MAFGDSCTKAAEKPTRFAVRVELYERVGERMITTGDFITLPLMTLSDAAAVMRAIIAWYQR